MHANLIVRHKADGRILRFVEVNVFDPEIEKTVARLTDTYRGEAQIDQSQVEMARAAAHRGQFTRVA